MNDFWIGDWVKILTTGQIGKYEGMIDSKAKIKTDGNFIFVSISQIEKLPDELIPEEEPQIMDNAIKVRKIESDFRNSLDLHIDKLNPSMVNEIPELILSFQLRKARLFIEEAINRRQFTITMIHGKGQGSLRMEIEHLLHDYSEFNFFLPVNNGGATQAFFKYY